MAFDSMPKPPIFTPLEACIEMREGAILVDIRESGEFGGGHVPGSINIQYSNKKFAERVAALIPAGVPLLLLAGDDEQTGQCCSALLAGEQANVIGYVAGGISAWRRAQMAVASLRQISIHELHDMLTGRDSGLTLLDVREPFEWEELGYIEGALLIPLGEVEKRRRDLGRPDTLVIICEHGFRSSTAASLLARHGLTNMMNVAEGMAGWRTARYPLVGWPARQALG